MKQIHLIYSSDARFVTREREETINALLPRDLRDENLVEIISTTNKYTVELQDILPQLLSELGTISLLPDNRRVVVVHNLADLYRRGFQKKSSKKRSRKSSPEELSKKEPLEILQIFMEKDLPQTENAVIFCAQIDYARQMEVDEKNALIDFLKKSPYCQVHYSPQKEISPLFLMGEALIARNAVSCLRHFQSINSKDMHFRIFSELLRNVRFLLQAKLLSHLEKKNLSRSTISMLYLPNDTKQSLYEQKEFVQKKYQQAMNAFTLRELMRASERLLYLNQYVIPGKNAAYVPDMALLMQTFIIEFCAGMQARRQS